ncbi:hypothetical protein K227x_50210 [Rubripirellula lacrimiformis]|uniref:Uncharacterized protein n=1 Tax=Rubripirellula lacrimiformis TaxID=1930273 RepID=A0A517NHK1_9BACT|nr:hypothetical protein K227x_50210 [Rubripirellula lacrimiformis]
MVQSVCPAQALPQCGADGGEAGSRDPKFKIPRVRETLLRVQIVRSAVMARQKMDAVNRTDPPPPGGLVGARDNPPFKADDGWQESSPSGIGIMDRMVAFAVAELPNCSKAGRRRIARYPPSNRTR